MKSKISGISGRFETVIDGERRIEVSFVAHDYHYATHDEPAHGGEIEITKVVERWPHGQVEEWHEALVEMTIEHLRQTQDRQ